MGIPGDNGAGIIEFPGTVENIDLVKYNEPLR
jgi:hypothetical protein